MKILIEGSVEEIKDLLNTSGHKVGEAFVCNYENADDKNADHSNCKKVLSDEELELIAIDAMISKLESVKTENSEKIRRGKVTHRGLKIGTHLYIFGNECDMWKYIGETITVVGENAFDVFGNNLGKIIPV